MSVPLVSVAMASYNGAKYIEEQIRTIRDQTWPNLELVVSDDGSTDGTIDILEAHRAAGHLRYTVNEQRLGLVGNFERAIASCGGELIALADQDDIWKTEKIATLVDGIGSAALAYCRVEEWIGPDNIVRPIEASRSITRFARKYGTGRPVRQLLAENWIVSHSVLLRRTVAQEALPVPAAFEFHDYWLALAAAVAGGVRFVDASLQIYRQHAGSFTYANRWNPGEGGGRQGSGFARSWDTRSRLALARLSAARARLQLAPREDGWARRLCCYYSLERGIGSAVAAAAAGVLLANSFATARSSRERLKIPLRPLLARLAVASSGWSRPGVGRSDAQGDDAR